MTKRYIVGNSIIQDQETKVNSKFIQKKGKCPCAQPAAERSGADTEAWSTLKTHIAPATEELRAMKKSSPSPSAATPA